MDIVSTYDGSADLVDVGTLLDHFQMDLKDLQGLMKYGYVYPIIIEDQFGGYTYLWSIQELHCTLTYFDELARGDN